MDKARALYAEAAQKGNTIAKLNLARLEKLSPAPRQNNATAAAAVEQSTAAASTMAVTAGPGREAARQQIQGKTAVPAKENGIQERPPEKP